MTAAVWGAGCLAVELAGLLAVSARMRNRQDRARCQLENTCRHGAVLAGMVATPLSFAVGGAVPADPRPPALMLPRASKPSSWIMSSIMVRCTSLSPGAGGRGAGEQGGAPQWEGEQGRASHSAHALHAHRWRCTAAARLLFSSEGYHQLAVEACAVCARGRVGASRCCAYVTCKRFAGRTAPLCRPPARATRAHAGRTHRPPHPCACRRWRLSRQKR